MKHCYLFTFRQKSFISSLYSVSVVVYDWRLLRPPSRLCFCRCLFVCLSVCC